MARASEQRLRRLREAAKAAELVVAAASTEAKEGGGGIEQTKAKVSNPKSPRVPT